MFLSIPFCTCVLNAQQTKVVFQFCNLSLPVILSPETFSRFDWFRGAQQNGVAVAVTKAPSARANAVSFAVARASYSGAPPCTDIMLQRFHTFCHVFAGTCRFRNGKKYIKASQQKQTQYVDQTHEKILSLENAHKKLRINRAKLFIPKHGAQILLNSFNCQQSPTFKTHRDEIMKMG